MFLIPLSLPILKETMFLACNMMKEDFLSMSLSYILTVEGINPEQSKWQKMSPISII